MIKHEAPIWNFRSRRNELVQRPKIETKLNLNKDSVSSNANKRPLFRNSMKIISPGTTSYQLSPKNYGTKISQ
jgi:hypothetical protein